MDFETNIPYIYVDTDSGLESLLGRLTQAHRVAVDIEADSLHHYFEKICLIQLTLNNENFIVDPLCGIDINKLMPGLAEKDIVFHGGDYDLRMLRSSYGFKPCGEIFDTMLAAQLLGFEKYGLSALLEQFFNVNISKRHQRADWSKRPLKKSLLDYACNDTRHLLTLAGLLAGELNKLGRSDWHRQSCRSMVRATCLKKPIGKAEDIWRIKGTSLMRDEQLVFVCQLWLWRQNQAKRADLPPFKIMHNSLILELAVWLAANPNTLLEKGPRLPRNFTGRRLSSLKKAIGKATEIPKSEWPGPKKRKAHTYYDPKIKLLASTLRDECGRIAEKLGIDSSLIACRAAINAIAKKQPKNIEEIMKEAAMMRWQAEIIEPVVKTIFKR